MQFGQEPGGKRNVMVWETYNHTTLYHTTHYATHQMRSYRTAFDLLARINRGFQKEFADVQPPISLN